MLPLNKGHLSSMVRLIREVSFGEREHHMYLKDRIVGRRGVLIRRGPLYMQETNGNDCYIASEGKPS